MYFVALPFVLTALCETGHKWYYT